MLPFPSIKVQIEGVRYQAISVLEAHMKEVQEYADQQIKEAIESFDFGLEIRKAIREVLQEAIVGAVQSSFKYGEGRQRLEYEIAKIVTPKTNRKQK